MTDTSEVITDPDPTQVLERPVLRRYHGHHCLVLAVDRRREPGPYRWHVAVSAPERGDRNDVRLQLQAQGYRCTAAVSVLDAATRRHTRHQWLSFEALVLDIGGDGTKAPFIEVAHNLADAVRLADAYDHVQELLGNSIRAVRAWSC